MSVNSLASALRALGSSSAVQNATQPTANPFAALGKDFEMLMQALGPADSGAGSISGLAQGSTLASPAQLGADQLYSGLAAGNASAAPQVSSAHALRVINATAAPPASVGRTISVTA